MLTDALIFDGHNTFIRNYAVNPTMDANGNPIGGVIGMIRSIKFLVNELSPARVFVVWDGAGGSRHRRSIYSEYKAGRKPRLNRELDENVKDAKENMDYQRQLTVPLLKFLGVSQVEIGDIEADDAIAYMVGCLEPLRKVVVSSDRDLWQLASPTTSIYWPVKKTVITDQTMKDDGCLAENWVIAKALQGDASDNIPGVKGIGPKTISKLFPELSQRVLSIAEFFQLCEEKREKYPKAAAIIAARDLVNQNVELMQLSHPVISTTSATVIRQCIDGKPVFNMTGFKLAMMNKGIQLNDADISTVFRAYQMRYERAAA